MNPQEIAKQIRKKKKREKLWKPKNYVCGECGIAFISGKDLNRHKVVHTGEKPYSCPYCSQKFTAPSSRATHIRSIHEKTQEYVCPQCDKDFNQTSALRRHIKIVHKKELPHMCHCGKKFALA